MKVQKFAGGAKGVGGKHLKGKNTFKKFNKDGKKENGVSRPGQNRFEDDQQDGLVPHFQKEEKQSKHKKFDDGGKETVSKPNKKNKFANGVVNGNHHKNDGEESKHKRFDGGGKKKKEHDENSPVSGNEQKKGKKNKKKEGKGGVTREMPAVKHREGQKWFQYQMNEQIKDPSDRLEAEKAKPIEEEADLLLRTDQDLYSRLMRSQSGGEAAWLQTIMAKGTAGDRKTAMTLQTKSSPVHSISFIRSMVHTVERQNVRESMELIPLLTEVFVDELLPSDRKLVSFGSRPLARINEICAHSVQTRKRLLVLWRFEHELKLVYERFTKALESLASGAIEKLCVACVEAGQNLLVQRMEQENFLLQLLVNKLGHPNGKVAHRCETLLGDLSRKQMNMRPSIVTEVERLIYRRNVSERAQQHAASFLSQLVLRAGENELAVQLLSIYFGLFKTLVAAKKTDGKLVGILLAGANRAFPYAKGKTDSLVDEMESLYRLVHQAPFGVALQTLKLLHHVLGINDSLSDRFYATLYRKLFDHAPSTSQHQLLDLLWKTLKTDQVTSRVRAFVKRLLQIASSESAGFAAGILILVSRLIESRPQLIVRERDAQNEMLVDSVVVKGVKGVEVEDDEEERYVDLDDDGTPLERGVKGEKMEGKEEESEDEVKEVIVSVKGQEKIEKDDDKKKVVKGRLQPLPTKGWVHRKNQAHHGGVSLYSSSARNPLFISTDGTFDAELVLLTQHYHPSIVVFAQTLIQGSTINYGADPLEDFTTISFLDRFVYRNPKTTITSKGVLGVQKKGAVGVKALPISSLEYVSKSVHEIPADERFLHRFASLKFAAKGEKRAKGEDYDDDAASVNSDEFERVMERFEPGEANDDFDIDFGKEFSSEKTKKEKKGTKRKISDVDGEEDEDEDEDGEADADGWSDEDMEDMEDDEDEGGEGDEDVEMEEDDDEDDEDIEIEGEESEDDYGLTQSNKGKRGYSDDESDEDYGENDAFVSADRFAEEMEGFRDEESREQRKERLKKKVKRVKGRKVKK